MILSKARGNYYVEDKRFAMLIDSDNISSKYISAIIDEMTKYGTVTYNASICQVEGRIDN